MVVHPAAVAAQALGEVLGRLLEGAVGVRRLALARMNRLRPALRLMSQAKKARLSRWKVTFASSA